jgi:CheY-like chemotaxis protein
MLILIVEDEPIIAMSLALELEASGHTVLGPTSTSLEAIDLVRHNRPALALLDITIEGEGDGIDLARGLQLLGIPSVFLTAEQAQARANSDAALGLIAKPYTTTGVCRSLEIIAAILEGRAHAPRTGALEIFRH